MKHETPRPPVATEERATIPEAREALKRQFLDTVNELNAANADDWEVLSQQIGKPEGPFKFYKLMNSSQIMSELAADYKLQEGTPRDRSPVWLLGYFNEKDELCILPVDQSLYGARMQIVESLVALRDQSGNKFRPVSGVSNYRLDIAQEPAILRRSNRGGEEFFSKTKYGTMKVGSGKEFSQPEFTRRAHEKAAPFRAEKEAALRRHEEERAALERADQTRLLERARALKLELETLIRTRQEQAAAIENAKPPSATLANEIIARYGSLLAAYQGTLVARFEKMDSRYPNPTLSRGEDGSLVSAATLRKHRTDAEKILPEIGWLEKRTGKGKQLFEYFSGVIAQLSDAKLQEITREEKAQEEARVNFAGADKLTYDSSRQAIAEQAKVLNKERDEFFKYKHKGSGKIPAPVEAWKTEGLEEWLVTQR